MHKGFKQRVRGYVGWAINFLVYSLAVIGLIAIIDGKATSNWWIPLAFLFGLALRIVMREMDMSSTSNAAAEEGR